MPRADISNYLVHFTKGNNAFADFTSIIKEATLRGGTGYIKGGYRCVCFSEAPLHALQTVLEQPRSHDFKYSPYGVVVSKRWLFALGGRPVIYQSDLEYGELPEKIRWRHVRYEPTLTNPIDHTAEREWRIQLDKLALPEEAILVMPNLEELREICDEHSLADHIPADLYDPLKDTTPLSALISGRRWTVILVRDPPEGWSGLDVDLD
jgi:hypothetical protein